MITVLVRLARSTRATITPEVGPTTATAPSPSIILVASRIPTSGLPPVSATTVRRLPHLVPPAAFTSATPSSTAPATILPNSPSSPVSGTSTPMVTSCALAASVDAVNAPASSVDLSSMLLMVCVFILSLLTFWLSLLDLKQDFLEAAGREKRPGFEDFGVAARVDDIGRLGNG